MFSTAPGPLLLTIIMSNNMSGGGPSHSTDIVAEKSGNCSRSVPVSPPCLSHRLAHISWRLLVNLETT